MRRLIISLIAATALTLPGAAMAQRHGGGGHDRGGWHNGGHRGGGHRASQPARVSPRPSATPRAIRAPARQDGPRRAGASNRQRDVARGPSGYRGAEPARVSPRQSATPRAIRSPVRQDAPRRAGNSGWQREAVRGRSGAPRDTPAARGYRDRDHRSSSQRVRPGHGTPPAAMTGRVERQRSDRYRDGDRRHRDRGVQSYRHRADGRGWRGRWNHDWRNDRRYNWRHHRTRYRHIYHLQPYYAPYRHWSYRRFSIGFFLDPLFFGRSYWIGDPFYYRLPPAPPGTQWVRYYNDVLLVDVYTGEVLDAIYDFFW